MAEQCVASHYDLGNTDIVGDIAGDSSMTNRLLDQYDNAAFSMLILGAS